MTKLKVLIVGAGIGGLTLALALIRRGVDVQVVEQASELGEVGAGVQISPNGIRVLDHLGIGESIRDVAFEPDGKEIRLWNTAQSWKLFDLAAEAVTRYGHPYLMFHRADLHTCLYNAIEAAAPGTVVTDFTCSSSGQESRRPWIENQHGERLEADIVVGCDGIHSSIRQHLFDKDQPEFTGIIAWRGIVPIDQLPAGLVPNLGVNWVGPGGHVINYRLRRGSLLNFVGVVERDDWQVESWTSAGTTDELHRDFENWHPNIHTMIDAIDTPFKWALMGRAPMPHWSKGAMTLLGDACHPMLPFMAQGAVMAIEDGLILARCISDFDDAEKALRSYEAVRHARTTRCVEVSLGNAKRFHNPALGTASGAADYVEREWSEEKVVERYDWLFSYTADSVELTT